MNTGLLIGGKHVDGAEDERIVVLNPATGEPRHPSPHFASVNSARGQRGDLRVL